MSWKVETTFHYCWRVKSSLKLVWIKSTSPCKSLVVYSLKRHGLSIISLTKSYFDHLFVIESPLKLRALAEKKKTEQHRGHSPVPEIIDPVFTKTSPKRSFSMSEHERFGLVFTKTRVYKIGHCFGSEFTIQRRLCLCFLLHILLPWSGSRCQMCPTVHIYIQLPFPCVRYIFSISPIPQCFNHRVNRVAITTFWRTYHREGKISPGWWGWGCSPFTFTLSTITYKVVRNTSWEGRYTPWFLLYPICTLWSKHFHYFEHWNLLTDSNKYKRKIID